MKKINWKLNFINLKLKCYCSEPITAYQTIIKTKDQKDIDVVVYQRNKNWLVNDMQTNTVIVNQYAKCRTRKAAIEYAQSRLSNVDYERYKKAVERTNNQKEGLKEITKEEFIKLVS